MRSQAIRLFGFDTPGLFRCEVLFVQRKTTIAAARRILADWNHPDVGEAIDELGELIAVNPDDAEAVIAMLASDKSLQADTLRAELLVWIARGDETPSWKLKQMAIKPRPMETERLGAAGRRVAFARRSVCSRSGRMGPRHSIAHGIRMCRRANRRTPGRQAMAGCQRARLVSGLGRHRSGSDARTGLCSAGCRSRRASYDRRFARCGGEACRAIEAIDGVRQASGPNHGRRGTSVSWRPMAY